MCVCLYAREHTFVKSRLPFPWAAKKRTVREVTVRGGKNKENDDRMEGRPYVLFLFSNWGRISRVRKNKTKKDLRGGLLLAKWKQASAKQITSQKWSDEINWNGAQRRLKTGGRDIQRDEHIGRWGILFGVAASQSRSSSAIPSLCELWLRWAGEEEELQTRKIKAN